MFAKEHPLVCTPSLIMELNIVVLNNLQHGLWGRGSLLHPSNRVSCAFPTDVQSLGEEALTLRL